MPLDRRTTGGVVNAITKRGSNIFRGSAFGYLTNSAMTAQTSLAIQAGTGESDTDKHQWGGTFGGPIVRDKLHFFASFERYVIGTGLTNVFRNASTCRNSLALRPSRFSSLLPKGAAAARL